MKLHGKNLIAGTLSKALDGESPSEDRVRFEEATHAQIEAALRCAQGAFAAYQALPMERVATFLEEIGEQIIALGDDLILRANEETALPQERLISERGRTVNQLKMFADLLREGSWAEASIDRALPERKPLPRPDLRRMLTPIGPIVVFGASNFPLAFSVAGGDTASALAARCPVIVKAHPAHPGTSELVGRAIQKAVTICDMPEGVFSLLHGVSNEVGLSLVRHPMTKAVAFTGSLRGGRALFDAAAARHNPIPVFAEMGSINPIFILPEALAQRGEQFADGLFRSVTMGVGQFCTCPGLVAGVQGEGWSQLKDRLFARATSDTSTHKMLTQNIAKAYAASVAAFASLSEVESSEAPSTREAAATIFSTNAKTFMATPKLSEEVFGPATLLVACEDEAELLAVARHLEGQLTASIHATEGDLKRFSGLAPLLIERAGRLLFDGFPTGVEVCASMNHGGPYPATTFAHFTSVGTTAIKRFTKPICYQNAPQSLLPEELQDANPRKIWRLVDNQMTRE